MMQMKLPTTPKGQIALILGGWLVIALPTAYAFVILIERLFQ